MSTKLAIILLLTALAADRVAEVVVPSAKVLEASE